MLAVYNTATNWHDELVLNFLLSWNDLVRRISRDVLRNALTAT